MAIAVSVLAGLGTTTVSARAISCATFMYDASTIVRVGVNQINSFEAVMGQHSDARDGSASPSVESWGSSTTPADTFVATNTAAVDDLSGSALSNYNLQADATCGGVRGGAWDVIRQLRETGVSDGGGLGNPRFLANDAEFALAHAAFIDCWTTYADPRQGDMYDVFRFGPVVATHRLDFERLGTRIGRPAVYPDIGVELATVVFNTRRTGARRQRATPTRPTNLGGPEFSG